MLQRQWRTRQNSISGLSSAKERPNEQVKKESLELVFIREMRIVLKGLEPGIDIASLCRLEGGSPTQYQSYKKQLVSKTDAIVGGKRGSTIKANET